MKSEELKQIKLNVEKAVRLIVSIEQVVAVLEDEKENFSKNGSKELIKLYNDIVDGLIVSFDHLRTILDLKFSPSAFKALANQKIKKKLN